jgi:hypothetical protein
MNEQKQQIFPTYEQSMLLLALVETYKVHPTAIAMLCDNHLCPSGSLLGVVQTFARLREST